VHRRAIVMVVVVDDKEERSDRRWRSFGGKMVLCATPVSVHRGAL
jgi:hypothetical protein